MREQIRGLYARDAACFFRRPASMLMIRSFAQSARRPDGSPERGRIYVGVHAPGLGSLQTVQVRTLRRCSRPRNRCHASERDPWWTLLLFFNSLRELGTTLTLFQSDIPDFLRDAEAASRLGFQDVRRSGTCSNSRGGCPAMKSRKQFPHLKCLPIPNARACGRCLPGLEHHRSRRRH